MWRINNILLLIVLLAVIPLLGFSFLRMAKQHLEMKQYEADSVAALEAKSLRSDPVTDVEGRRLSTAAISVDRIIRNEQWDQWSVVVLGVAGRETPVPAKSTAEWRSDSQYDRAPALTRWGSIPGSNLVLRNASTDARVILFDRKVAMTEFAALATGEASGIVVAFADSDSNKDGKLTFRDRQRLSYFRFANPVEVQIPFEGIFIEFETEDAPGDFVRFYTGLDLNADGRLDRNYDTLRTYEIEQATGTAGPAIDADTLDKAQAIIDGTAAE